MNLDQYIQARAEKERKITIELLSHRFSDEVLETSNSRNQNQAWLLGYSYSDKISEPSNSWNQNLAYWIRVMELKLLLSVTETVRGGRPESK